MKLICFGDSNTWGYDPADKFGQAYSRRWTDILAEKTSWQVINEGVNGREVPDESADIPTDADLFLVMLGTNDLLQLDTPEAAAERMEGFLSSANPRKVVLVAPPAMVWGEWVQDEELIADSRRLAQLYEALSIRLGIRFLNADAWNIPLAFDGVHFTQAAQEVFADALAKELMR
ncbi:MAG: lipase [Oscillospiraceae bacterium]|nr:lipase [Oscillospiraceae bacterium]